MAQYFRSPIIHKSVQPPREARVGQEGSRYTSLESPVRVPGVLGQEGTVKVPGTPEPRGCVALLAPGNV